MLGGDVRSTNGNLEEIICGCVHGEKWSLHGSAVISRKGTNQLAGKVDHLQFWVVWAWWIGISVNAKVARKFDRNRTNA